MLQKPRKDLTSCPFIRKITSEFLHTMSFILYQSINFAFPTLTLILLTNLVSSSYTHCFAITPKYNQLILPLSFTAILLNCSNLTSS